MSPVFWTTYGLLWTILAVLAVLVILLYRQFGVMIMPGPQRINSGGGWLGTVYFGWILGTSLFTQMITPLVQAIAVLAATLGVWFGISVGVGMGLARSVPPWAGAFSRNDLQPTDVIRRFASRAHGFRVAGLTMALVLLLCAAAFLRI